MIDRAMQIIGTNQANKKGLKNECYNQTCAVTAMHIALLKELL